MHDPEEQKKLDRAGKFKPERDATRNSGSHAR